MLDGASVAAVFCAALYKVIRVEIECGFCFR